LLTNAYIVYCQVMDEAGIEKKSHYKFLYDIAIAWIDLHEVDIREHVKASRNRFDARKAAAAAEDDSSDAIDETC
jgi:hypothetical protein